MNRRGFLGVLAGAIAAPLVMPRSAFIALPRGIIMPTSSSVHVIADMLRDDIRLPVFKRFTSLEGWSLDTSMRSIFGQEQFPVFVSQCSVSAEGTIPLEGSPMAGDLIRIGEALFQVRQVTEL
jgi:hypothetical protein